MADLTSVSLHEVFEKVANVTKISEKVKVLQTYDVPPVRAVLRGAYDPTIKWLLPTGKPPFTPNDAEDWDLAPTRLDVVIMNQIKKYVARLQPDGSWGKGVKMESQTRREQSFIELIEGLHPTEAEIVFMMINRKMTYKGLTPKLVDQAFPGLIPNGTTV